MNDNAIKATILITGLGAGGVGGYFLAKRKYRLLADEEIESVKEAFRELRQIADRDADQKKAPPAPPVENDLRGPVGHPGLGPRTESQDGEFIAYNKVVGASGYVASDSEVDRRDVKPEKVESVEVHESSNGEVTVQYKDHSGYQAGALLTAAAYEERREGQPYIIDVGEFINNEAEFDVETLTWHPADQTLVWDDSQDVVEDHNLVGGAHVLRAFGNDVINPFTIYVRDDANEKLYEIVQDARRYSEGNSV